MYDDQDSNRQAVRQLAEQIYTEKRTYLMGIGRRNALNEADAEEALHETFASFIQTFDPAGEAPPVAWLTLALKRQCWKLREKGDRSRTLGSDTERGGQDGRLLTEASSPSPRSLEDRVADRDEARSRLARLKPDERTAIGLHAAGLSYEEIGAGRGWTRTKVNRCLYEGRLALLR